MSTTLLKNVTYVNEGATRFRDILIENGHFSRIDNNISAKDEYEIIDCKDFKVLPGVIDDQVHFREPGMTHKASIASESAAAVLGGTTSFMDMPNNIPPAISTKDLNSKKEIAAKDSVANYSFYLGATSDNLEEIKSLDPKNVCGVKVFMGSSTGNLLVEDDEALRKIFLTSQIPVATHCEDNAIINANLTAFTQKYGNEIEPYMHALIRSREACYKSTKKAVDLATETNANLHVLHLSTKEEIDLFKPYASEKVESRKITAEVCAHHLFFNSSYYKNLGTKIKCNPAIKDEDDRQSLVQAVENGIITNIATDHAPHTREEKEQPFVKAPSGLPLIQYSLLAVLELVHRGELSIEAAVTALSHNTAKRFNISDRGFIKEGYWADLVIIKPNVAFTVMPHEIVSKCGWSPFVGMTFNNKVLHTFVNGNQVVKDGKLVTGMPKGKEILFNR
jgi:dihydroorotase